MRNMHLNNLFEIGIQLRTIFGFDKTIKTTAKPILFHFGNVTFVAHASEHTQQKLKCLIFVTKICILYGAPHSFKSIRFVMPCNKTRCNGIDANS